MEPQREIVLDIAGLRLRFRCAAEGLLIEAPHAPTLGFTGPTHGLVDLDLLVVDNPAPAPTGARIFDTGDAWSVHEHGQHWLIRLDSRKGNGDYLWSVLLDRGAGEGILHSGPVLLSAHRDGRIVRHLVQYPLDQILVMLELTRRGGLLIHAAACEVDGVAIVFPGVSGAGKSTLVGLLAEQVDLHWLSDDRVTLREVDERFVAAGTPWPGEAGVASRRQAPLGALCFLSHDERGRLKPLSARDAFHRLLPVASVPWFDADLTATALDTCGRLVTGQDCFELAFRRDAGEVYAELSTIRRAV